MTLIMTLLVRDEEDILQANIDFHLAQGVDFIIATDNLSVDSTADILRQYERRGLLHYIYEDSDTYSQHEWVTRMARMAYLDYGADWVINNDADEFWWPKKGSLIETLSSMQADKNIVEAERRNFVYLKDTDPTGSFYESMIYKEVNSVNSLGGPLPPKVAHRGCRDIIVRQGNHSVSGIGQECVVANTIEILHFPIRTREQFLNKIILGGAAYQRNTICSGQVNLAAV